MSQQPNANMVTSSFDRIQGTTINPIYQPVNNFRIQNQGGNIVQGQLNKISVTEVMLPYTTPTINENNYDFRLKLYYIDDTGHIADDFYGAVSFSLDKRFYSGQEIVAALNALVSGAASGSQPMSDFLLWEWDDVANQISVKNNSPNYDPSPVDPGQAGIYIEIDLPYGPTLIEGSEANIFNFPNFWFTIGFRNIFATNPEVDYFFDGIAETKPIQLGLYPADTPTADLPTNAFSELFGSFYTGRYTDYVDIVSTSLCQAQYTRDSTTSQNTARRDVIARMYVCNNMSMIPLLEEGSRPVILYRMFPVPKVMKWTADRSLDAIDLQLFDMYGQPLPTQQLNETQSDLGRFAYAGDADYAITFHVHEPGADTQEANIGYSYQ